MKSIERLKRRFTGHIHGSPNYKCLKAEKSWGGGNFSFAFKSSLMTQGCGKISFLHKKIRPKWVVNVFFDFFKFSIKMYREIAKNHKKFTFLAFEHGKWRF